MLLDEIDWFHAKLPGKWGLGACPTCNPAGSEDAAALQLRFGTAHAYGVVEMDMFAFGAGDEPQWAAYWPYTKAFLECTDQTAGHCWPSTGQQ